MHRGDDAGALSDFNEAIALSREARGEYFVERARARARVAMRSNGREEAFAGVQVAARPVGRTKAAYHDWFKTCPPINIDNGVHCRYGFALRLEQLL